MNMRIDQILALMTPTTFSAARTDAPAECRDFPGTAVIRQRNPHEEHGNFKV